MSPDEASAAYANMWEDFGKEKSSVYNERKFSLVNRVGLTNFIREECLMKKILSVCHDSVLDIGCASGRQVFALSHFCKSVQGVDIAQSFVDECMKQKITRGIENVHFAVADFSSLPEGSYDVVICAEVLEHVLDLPSSIRAIYHALKKGGHAVITVPHFNADGTWWGRLLRIMGIRSFFPIHSFSAEEIKKHGDAHVREFSCRQLALDISAAGFNIKSICTVSHLDGPWGDRIITAILDRLAFTRSFFIFFEHCFQILLPRFGRHIVLLAQK